MNSNYNDTYKLLINQSTDKLLIVFSHREAKGFAAYKLAQKTNMSILYLKDPGNDNLGCSWYNGKIDNLSKNCNELLEFLKSIIQTNNFKYVVTIGSSMGGYASILFGNLLNVNLILAFVPQILIDGKLPRNPDHSKHKIIFENLIPIMQNNIKTNIFIGTNDIIDLYNALLCRNIPNVEIVGINGLGHLLLEELSEINKNLTESIFLDSIATNGEIPNWIMKVDLKFFSQAHILLIEKFLYSFYFEKDNSQALKFITTLTEKCPLFNVFWHWSGILNYNTKYYEKAIESINKAIALGHQSKFNYMVLARSYYELKLYDSALKYFLITVNEEKFSSESIMKIGVSYFHLSEYTQSIYWLSKHMNLIDSFQVLEYLIRAYMSIGMFDNVKYILRNIKQQDQKLILEKIKGLNEVINNK